MLSDKLTVTCNERRSKIVGAVSSGSYSRSAAHQSTRAQKWVHSEKVHPLFDFTLLWQCQTAFAKRGENAIRTLFALRHRSTEPKGFAVRWVF